MDILLKIFNQTLKYTFLNIYNSLHVYLYLFMKNEDVNFQSVFVSYVWSVDRFLGSHPFWSGAVRYKPVKVNSSRARILHAKISKIRHSRDTGSSVDLKSKRKLHDWSLRLCNIAVSIIQITTWRHKYIVCRLGAYLWRGARGCSPPPEISEQLQKFKAIK